MDSSRAVVIWTKRTLTMSDIGLVAAAPLFEGIVEARQRAQPERAGDVKRLAVADAYHRAVARRARAQHLGEATFVDRGRRRITIRGQLAPVDVQQSEAL